MSADRIERETFIEAPVERVWEIVTESEHLGRWFGDSGAEVDLRPGGAMSLSWQEHGTCHAVVETVEEPHRFAFRWAAAMEVPATETNSTHVEFTLAGEGEGTRLRVVETGFAALDMPEADRTAKVDDNTDGWRIKMGELADYLAARPAAR